MVHINNIGHQPECFNRLLAIFLLYTSPHTSVGLTGSISIVLFSVLNMLTHFTNRHMLPFRSLSISSEKKEVCPLTSCSRVNSGAECYF